MDPLAFLHARRSTPSRLLGEPAPDDAQLLRLLEAAVRVPDHGKLVPFRFLRLRGDARIALGERLAARALERDPATPAAAVDKDRARFVQAPLVLVVVTRLQRGHKVPEAEQRATAACVCFALLQGAQAMGFGAQWLTGWAAYDPAILATLGLGPDEEVAGFVHLGTPAEAAPERARPDPRALLTDWTGA